MVRFPLRRSAGRASGSELDMKYATQSMECIMTSRKYGVKSKGRAVKERGKREKEQGRAREEMRKSVGKSKDVQEKNQRRTREEE